MFESNLFIEWKEGRELPEGGPSIPDHARGYDMSCMLDFGGPHERVDAYGRQWIWTVFPEGGFYPELLARYHAILEIEGAKLRPAEYYQSLHHLQRMLLQLGTDTTMSVTKKHRWLGYIQGVLAANGLLSVGDERNFTRDIFKGA